ARLTSALIDTLLGRAEPAPELSSAPVLPLLAAPKDSVRSLAGLAAAPAIDLTAAMPAAAAPAAASATSDWRASFVSALGAPGGLGPNASLKVTLSAAPATTSA
ncbi:MAG: hypothetical protein IT531_24130, partial [Burkholderiales bacterium]|nr:hypothetical protein [Burkholderiales bacterium]